MHQSVQLRFVQFHFAKTHFARDSLFLIGLGLVSCQQQEAAAPMSAGRSVAANSHYPASVLCSIDPHAFTADHDSEAVQLVGSSPILVATAKQDPTRSDSNDGAPCAADVLKLISQKWQAAEVTLACEAEPAGGVVGKDGQTYYQVDVAGMRVYLTRDNCNRFAPVRKI
jgi:hypothetical protein